MGRRHRRCESNLNFADHYGGRLDGIADGIDLMRFQISSGGRDDAGLQAFCCEHLFKCRAHVFVYSAVGRDLAVIKRDLRVELGIEIRTRGEGKVFETNRKEIGGRRQQKGQILAVEFESYGCEDPRTQQAL